MRTGDFAVSADRHFLRFFALRAEAERYALALVARCAPTLGTVRVERWNEALAEYRHCLNLGLPIGQGAAEDCPLQ